MQFEARGKNRLNHIWHMVNDIFPETTKKCAKCVTPKLYQNANWQIEAKHHCK